MELHDAYIVAYGRSAIGRSKKGALRELHPVDLAGIVLKGVVEKVPNLDPKDIEDLVVGCAFSEGKQGHNIGRLIAGRAGLGYEVPGCTVGRFCCSGIQAIDMAAMKIQTGAADVIVAGGVESMSCLRPGDPENFDPWLMENDKSYYIPMGLTAENVASQYQVAREEMDAFAVESHRRAAAAQAAGKFDDEIIPVPGLDADGNAIEFKKDEGIRPGTTIEKLSALAPCFKKENGTVTAATSSQTSDGAGFVVLMSKQALEKYGVKPLAKFHGCAYAGCDPKIMGVGPISAVPKILTRTGLSVEDLGVIELNEAFAAQALVCIKTLGFDMDRVNPNGGAIALGHPLGGTGAILLCKALSELKRTHEKYGLITMCIGGGMGAAGIIESLE